MTAAHPPLHWALLITLVVMWGSSFVLTKVAVSVLPPAAVAFGRIAVAALLLVALILLARRRLPRSRLAWRYLAIMSVVGYALPFMLISWGQQRIDSGLAGILMAVMPLATLTLAHFFIAGERLTPARASGFGLGFAGIVVLIGPRALLELGGGGTLVAGQLAVLGGALCYAVQSIVARRAPAGDVWVTSAVVLALAACLTAPFGVGSGNWSNVSNAAILAIVALGVISTAAASVVYYRLIALAGPSFLSLINYLIPLWAVALGMVFLDERPDWTSLAALGLILAGIALSQRGARRNVE